MNSAARTPVSVLQELCVKRGITPAYQDLQSTAPPHAPSFVCQVTCENRIAHGQGRSKKEAKHVAAQKMLDQLKSCPEFNMSKNDRVPTIEGLVMASPYENKLKENEVGPLSDFCAEYQLPTPDYTFVRDEGPAHDKRFTERCAVGSFAAEVTDRTKKQAKQMVAHQMKAALTNTIMPRANVEIEVENPDREFEEAKKKFPHCGSSFVLKLHSRDLTSKIIDEHSRYQEFYDLYKNAVDEFTQNIGENPEEKLDSLLKQAEVNYNVISFPVKEEFKNTRTVAINIDLSPPLNILSAGSTYEEALRKAAKKSLEFIKIMSVPVEYNSVDPISREEFEQLIGI